LLRNVRAAMEPGQTLVIAEPMAGNGSHAGNATRPPISASTSWLWDRAAAGRPKRSVALAKQAGFSRFDIRPVPFAADGDNGCRVSLTFVTLTM
jgi:demethylspheroidene O-methyltransferase